MTTISKHIISITLLLLSRKEHLNINIINSDNDKYEFTREVDQFFLSFFKTYIYLESLFLRKSVAALLLINLLDKNKLFNYYEILSHIMQIEQMTLYAIIHCFSI